MGGLGRSVSHASLWIDFDFVLRIDFVRWFLALGLEVGSQEFPPKKIQLFMKECGSDGDYGVN